MLSELQKHMPQRTLKLSRVGGGLITQITLGALGILIAGGLIFNFFIMAQPILKDRKMIDNWISVPAAQVIPFSDCSLGTSVKKNIFCYCNVKIIHNGQTIERSFSFFDFSSGDYNNSSIKAIAQKDNPSNMNVDLAIDKMSNRIMTVVFVACIALVAFLFIFEGFRDSRYKQRLKKIMNAPENQPWEFVAIPVTVYLGKNSFNSAITSYTTEVDGNSRKLSTRSKPIMLGKQANASLALGIKAKSQNTTVMLCEKLKKIDFTNAEKKQLLDIIKPL